MYIKKGARIENKYYKDFIGHLTSLQLSHTVRGRKKTEMK